MTFKEKFVHLSKSFKYSYATSDTSREAMAIFKNSVGPVKKSLKELKDGLQNTEKLTKKSTVISEDTNSTNENLVQSINDIIDGLMPNFPPFSTAIQEVKTLRTSTIADLNHYLDTVPVTSPPIVDHSSDSPIVVEPPIRSVDAFPPRTTTSAINITRMPKLFSLFPQPSLQRRFIKIDGNNLNSFINIGKKNFGTFVLNTESFYKVLDFKKISCLGKLEK
jgi:hypothetical protein